MIFGGLTHVFKKNLCRPAKFGGKAALASSTTPCSNTNTLSDLQAPSSIDMLYEFNRWLILNYCTFLKEDAEPPQSRNCSAVGGYCQCSLSLSFNGPAVYFKQHRHFRMIIEILYYRTTTARLCGPLYTLISVTFIMTVTL